MAQMKPETLRAKIDEAKCELILMDEITNSIRALKFKDSSFAYNMLAEVEFERPKTAARIERWTAMLAAREMGQSVSVAPGSARAKALAAAAERDSRTALPDDVVRGTRVRFVARDV